MTVLDEVEKELERRHAGAEPDRRFDLVLDVLADLHDELAASALGSTLTSDDPGLD